MNKYAAYAFFDEMDKIAQEAYPPMPEGVSDEDGRTIDRKKLRILLSRTLPAAAIGGGAGYVGAKVVSSFLRSRSPWIAPAIAGAGTLIGAFTPFIRRRLQQEREKAFLEHDPSKRKNSSGR